MTISPTAPTRTSSPTSSAASSATNSRKSSLSDSSTPGSKTNSTSGSETNQNGEWSLGRGILNRISAVCRIGIGSIGLVINLLKLCLCLPIAHQRCATSVSRAFEDSRNSFLLILQGTRQFFWYSTSHSSNSDMERDVVKVITRLGNNFIEQNWQSANPASNVSVPVRFYAKAIVGSQFHSPSFTSSPNAAVCSDEDSQAIRRAPVPTHPISDT